MIISFNPKIIRDQSSEIQAKLAKIFILFLEDNHLIDISSIDDIFFDDQNKYVFDQTFIAKKYLSYSDNQNLKEYICNIRQSITKLHRQYLTKLVIGNDLGEIHPDDAYRILKERSIVIVENNPNDWKFIRGIIDKYQSFGKRKNIYKLIKKSLDSDSHYLTYDHAGGSGIQAQIESWVNGIYHNIYNFKLMALFDSDKRHANDFKQDYKNLLAYLKARSISNPPAENDLIYEENDLIVWHMLFKRCIENYIPLDIMIMNITDLTDDHKANLKSLSPSDADFVQYYNPEGKSRNYYISIGKNKVKDQFPSMFLSDFAPNELEKRCSHHQVSILHSDGTTERISEIEQILLKIAKII
ncbi:hypothetical protein [Pseudanabaena sp. UWO310]|uniref:hypothetical protein n=1 Tax=Pseudanabaena sp. UWO310 TaxID=2480795 RepID=UPI0011606419|nr:hypothetical protein [Pseudanabaena sp. UWO310]TYQ24641.1 hypothetical protein PseudUWO310_20495 [Pseudanabaena sp. UWO310]